MSRPTPTRYYTLREVLDEARKHGCSVPIRRFRYWQCRHILPRPEIIPGKGNIGLYRHDAVLKLVQVSRSRRPLRELRQLDRRPIREVVGVLDDGVPTVLEVVDYLDLADGRTAKVLRDGSLLVSATKKEKP